MTLSSRRGLLRAVRGSLASIARQRDFKRLYVVNFIVVSGFGGKGLPILALLDSGSKKARNLTACRIGRVCLPRVREA